MRAALRNLICWLVACRAVAGYLRLQGARDAWSSDVAHIIQRGLRTDAYAGAEELLALSSVSFVLTRLLLIFVVDSALATAPAGMGGGVLPADKRCTLYPEFGVCCVVRILILSRLQA